mmetsp:Transcript_3157/g.5471  ORF Transcript_3157/g.5471 Transcript_3157/m.5471 type:complete len:125 (+) Transcript_3157:680-1054(+)
MALELLMSGSSGTVGVRQLAFPPTRWLESRTNPWADVVLPGKASERAVADDVTSAMPELPTTLQSFELEVDCPEELLHQQCRARQDRHHHQRNLQAAGSKGRDPRACTKTHKGALPGSDQTPGT